MTKTRRPPPTVSNRKGRQASRLQAESAAQQVLQPEEDQPQPQPLEEDIPQPQPLEEDIPAADDASVEGFPGGPTDTSVLRTYADHVATRLWDGVVMYLHLSAAFFSFENVI